MATKEESQKPDINQLMEKIRSKVRAEIESSKGTQRAFKPRKIEFDNIGSVSSGDLTRSEDLLFLNQNYVMSGLVGADSIVSHRKGIVGRLIVKFKQKFAKTIIESILSGYLNHEKEFFVHLVRFLNSSTRYTDARDSDIFWQLIHKIDTDVGKALERIERIRDEVSGASQHIEKSTNTAIQNSVTQINSSLGQILAQQQQHTSALATLDSVVRGLEGIMAMYSTLSSKHESNNSKVDSSPADIQVPDLSYMLLENRFRGSKQEIRERQQFYADYFSKAQKPILDVGCGRGELLELLREKGIAAHGIDLDQAMVDECKTKNLKVEKQDLISYLENIEDNSLGGLIALQVVEHLPHKVLIDFVRLAQRKVCAGGAIIFETINPTSMTALSSNYFRDPTHVFPQHPDTLGFLMSTQGLDVVQTKFLAPVPESSQLRELQKEVYMTPRWNEMVELFNHNIKILNSALFGYQDFCVVGRVRS